MKRIFMALALCASMFALTACGGGGSSSSDPAPTAKVSGVAVDPYIVGAVFCIDVNENDTCDAGEPESTASNEFGVFTFEQADVDANPNKPVIMKTAGRHNGVPYGYAGLKAVLSGSDDFVVSPLTTLLAKGLTKAEVAALLQVAGIADIDEEDIDDNPLEDIESGAEVNDQSLAGVRASIASYMMLKLIDSDVTLADLEGAEFANNADVIAVIQEMVDTVKTAITPEKIAELQALVPAGSPDIDIEDVISTAVTVCDNFIEYSEDQLEANGGNFGQMVSALNVHKNQNMNGMITHAGTANYVMKHLDDGTFDVDDLPPGLQQFAELANCEDGFMLNDQNQVVCYVDTDDDDDDSDNSDGDDPADGGDTAVSGTVVDPYVVGATFCVDLNNNWECDADEPVSSASDEEGEFEFATPPEVGSIILMKTAGTHNGVPYQMPEIYAKYTGDDFIVSPLTMVQADGFTDEQIVNMLTLAGLQGVTADMIATDPIDGLIGDDGAITEAKLAVLRANIALYALVVIAEGSDTISDLSIEEAVTSATTDGGAINKILKGVASVVNSSLNSQNLDGLTAGYAGMIDASKQFIDGGLPVINFADVVRVSVAIADRVASIGYTACNEYSSMVPDADPVVSAEEGLMAVDDFLTFVTSIDELVGKLGPAYYMTRIYADLTDAQQKSLRAALPASGMPNSAELLGYLDCESGNFEVVYDEKAGTASVQCYGANAE